MRLLISGQLCLGVSAGGYVKGLCDDCNDDEKRNQKLCGTRLTVRIGVARRIFSWLKALLHSDL